MTPPLTTADLVSQLLISTTRDQTTIETLTRQVQQEKQERERILSEHRDELDMMKKACDEEKRALERMLNDEKKCISLAYEEEIDNLEEMLEEGRARMEQKLKDVVLKKMPKLSRRRVAELEAEVSRLKEKLKITQKIAEKKQMKAAQKLGLMGREVERAHELVKKEKELLGVEGKIGGSIRNLAKRMKTYEIVNIKLLQTVKTQRQELQKKDEVKIIDSVNADKVKKVSIVCEICLVDFRHYGEAIPRVLNCGHSLCTSCVKKLAEGGSVRCPYDRQTTDWEERVDLLPKNFTLLNVMEECTDIIWTRKLTPEYQGFRMGPVWPLGN